jgi:hypothetical protein
MRSEVTAKMVRMMSTRPAMMILAWRGQQGVRVKRRGDNNAWRPAPGQGGEGGGIGDVGRGVLQGGMAPLSLPSAASSARR